MGRAITRRYFPNPDKFLFISYTLEKEEVERSEFEEEGQYINYVLGIRYLDKNKGPQEDMEYWVYPHV